MKKFVGNTVFLLFSILLFASSLLIYRFFIFQKQEIDLEATKEAVLESLQNKVSEAKKIHDNVRNIVADYDYPSFSNLQQNSSLYYYVYKNKNLLYWSTNKYYPSYEYIAGGYHLKYFYFRFGKFLVVRHSFPINSDQYETFVLIPLTYRFPIKNSFIHSGLNTEVLNFKEATINNDVSTPGIKIFSKKGNYLFSISIPNPGPSRNNTALYSILVLTTVGVISYGIFIGGKVLRWISKGRILLSLLVVMINIIVLRGLLLYLNLPFSLFEWDLFNSKYFASSVLSPSLGDLLIDISLLTSFNVLLFFVFPKSRRLKSMLIILRKHHWTSVLIVAISFLGYYQIYLMLLNINRHSRWILDINQSIYFNNFKIVSLLIFVLAGVNYFLLIHLAGRVLNFINAGRTGLKVIYIVTLLPFCFILFYFHLIENPVLAGIHFVFLMILILFDLPRFLHSLKFETYLYCLVTAGICCLAGTISIYQQDHERTLIQKNKFASQIMTENDVLGEYLLSEAQQKIEKDQFIKSQFLAFFSNKDLIVQKIKKLFLPNYFEKYDVKISLFDSQGLPLNAYEEFQNYREAAETFGKKEYMTDYRNVFFFRARIKGDNNRYIVFNRIVKNDVTVGFILIQLYTRKVTPNSIYPELLVDEKFGQPSQIKWMNYAVYQKNQLTNNFGTINYQREFRKTWLNDKDLFNEGIVAGGYHHWATYDTDQKIVVVSTSSYGFKEIFSNFSFLYIVFILTILLGLFFVALYFRIKAIPPSYSSKIQIYLNIAFFLPLFIVSITILSAIASEHSDTLQRSFEEKAVSIGKNISTYLEDKDNEIFFDNITATLNQLSKYTNSDLNYYTPNGRLYYSSQPMIFETGLLSRLINPQALTEIREAKKSLISLPESIGNLKYNSVYVAVTDNEADRLMGIVSIPYYESKQELERQMINVLTTILNIFISIFIIFLILSYFASRVLTIPFEIITSKIKKTTLNRSNEPLDWETKDEIGLLVGEYNKMLLKLEQSKEALSKNEKEMAWREMARQVAHEIKNPLTPMKLTIQYLQKGFKSKDEDMGEKVEKGLGTLLTQVDHLSEIATSFSTFAKMPLPKNEIVSITALLHSVTALYNNSAEAIVISNIPEDEILVKGDNQSFNGVFSNLIINGIQSVPSSRKPVIQVNCSIKEKTVLITITDNGSGIPEAIRHKIFIPNFSTKYSGSGIGLAVAKRSVEDHGGQIWFETNEDSGTTFFIKLLLVQ